MSEVEAEAVIAKLLPGLRARDPDAQRCFWEFVGPHLRRVAERRMDPGLKQRVPSEDPVNSACLSFFAYISADDREFAGWQHVWAHLCASLGRKIVDRLRTHRAMKRDYRRDTRLDEPREATGEYGIDDASDAGEALGDGFEQDIREVLDELIARLPDERSRRVVRARLEDPPVPLGALASEFGVSVPRISQIHTQALKSLPRLAADADAGRGEEV